MSVVTPERYNDLTRSCIYSLKLHSWNILRWKCGSVYTNILFVLMAYHLVGFVLLWYWVVIFVLFPYYILICMYLEMKHRHVWGLLCEQNICVSRSTLRKVKEFIYWLFQGSVSFMDPFCCFNYVSCLSLLCCLFCSLQARKGWSLGSLVCCVSLCFRHVLSGILFQVRYLIVLIPDLCLTVYFKWFIKIKHFSLKGPTLSKQTM